jgi:hypothetical protein
MTTPVDRDVTGHAFIYPGRARDACLQCGQPRREHEPPTPNDDVHTTIDVHVPDNFRPDIKVFYARDCADFISVGIGSISLMLTSSHAVRALLEALTFAETVLPEAGPEPSPLAELLPDALEQIERIGEPAEGIEPVGPDQIARKDRADNA